MSALRWNHNSILGYSDTETVKLDFDGEMFRKVRFWARRAKNWHKLGGFLMLKSSEKCYHVIFDRKVSWSENMRIMAWVALLSRNEGLRRYQMMQCIKQSSTLRVSPKREKPSPRIVYREGKQDDQIKSYLVHRRQIKRMMKKLSN